MIGRWLRARLAMLANRVRHPERQPEVAAGYEPAKRLEVTLPSALVGASAPIRVLWGEPSGDLAAYERGRSIERAWCIAKIKHWFGGDDPFDQGYECVREINELKLSGEDNR